MRRLAPIALLAALSACGGSSTPTGTSTFAVISLSVSPNPIATAVSNPTVPTWTVRWTTTIKESAGLGGTVLSLRATLFDGATGAPIGSTSYDDKDLLVFIGSQRVEALGSLVVPQEISYSATVVRPGSLAVEVQVKDDKGNTVNQSLLVKVT